MFQQTTIYIMAGDIVKDVLSKIPVASDSNAENNPQQGTQNPQSESVPPANDNNTPGETPNPEQPKNTPGEYTDEGVLNYLKSRGINITTVDELSKPATQPELTEDQKKAKEEARKKNMLKYGLDNGYVNSLTDYENYISDTKKSARDISFQNFKEKRLSQNPDLTEDEIRDEYADISFENYDEDDWRRKHFEGIIEKEKQDYIKSKYQSIEDLPNYYDNYEQSETKRTNYNRKVEGVLGSIPKELSYTITDENNEAHEYKFKLDDDAINTVRSLYQDENHFYNFGQKDISDEDLKQTIINTIQHNLFSKILNEVASAHTSSLIKKMSKGRLGSLEHREVTTGNANAIDPISKSVLDKIPIKQS